MPDMEYRSLGRTGVKVSKLCLGCMNLGTLVSKEESMRIIDKALDEGINFLDTANVYARGNSERIVGEALKRNGKRERVVLATKVFGMMADGVVCPRLFRHTNKLVFSGFRMIAITPVMPTLVPHLFHDSLYIEPLTTCCTALRPSH